MSDGEEYAFRPLSEVYNADDPYDAKLVSWRALCFERLGFTALAAAALAVRRDVDRERVSTMVGAGATPEQVVAILL